MPKFYGQYCPIAKSLDVVGDRWTLLIVRDLLRGKRRFKDLEASLSGIAPNLLSDRLKKLEQAGLIVRHLFKQVPPRVEYALTDKGRSLETVLSSLARFGMANLMDKPGRDEVLDPELIFNAMPTVAIPSAARGVNALYQVTLSGPGGGSWFVSVSARKVKVTRGPVKREPDVSISTDARTWALLATGQMRPRDAEGSGLLTVEGDRRLAELFGEIFAPETRREPRVSAP